MTVLYTKFNDLIKLLLEPADYEGAAQCFKDPESCPRVTDVVVAAMQNLTVPEQMECFKCHYQVTLDVAFENGTKTEVEGLYSASGACQEEAKSFGCKIKGSDLPCEMKASKLLDFKDH